MSLRKIGWHADYLSEVTVMSSISDLVSSTAASNPYVGGIVASSSVQAGILDSIDPASPDYGNSDDLTNLIADANSQAALSPAASYKPSSDLTAAMNAAASKASSGSTPLSVGLATARAGTESSLIDGLGGALDTSA